MNSPSQESSAQGASTQEASAQGASAQQVPAVATPANQPQRHPFASLTDAERQTCIQALRLERQRVHEELEEAKYKKLMKEADVSLLRTCQMIDERKEKQLKDILRFVRYPKEYLM